MVPNKTIYVSEDDLPLYRRAQEIAGGSLSSAITAALRRYINVEEGRQEGFEDVTVQVGPGVGRKVRFSGILLGEWAHSTNHKITEYRVYRTRTGKYAAHTTKSREWTDSATSGDWVKDLSNWRLMLGLDEHSWGFKEGEATLEIAENLDELRHLIPEELFGMVAAAAEYPNVEDLDI